MASSNPTLLLTANKDIERFLSKVNIPNDPDACWEWQGIKGRQGYGRFRYNQKEVKSHRFAYRFLCGEIGDLWVLHRCDNPPCVNPNHLFLGTCQDNIRDRDMKGRTARGLRQGAYTKPERRPRGDRNGARTKPENRVKQYGEANGASKLRTQDIIEIFRLRKEGLSFAKIGALLGVGPMQICRIVKGQRWPHLGLNNVTPSVPST